MKRIATIVGIAGLLIAIPSLFMYEWDHQYTLVTGCAKGLPIAMPQSTYTKQDLKSNLDTMVFDRASSLLNVATEAKADDNPALPDPEMNYAYVVQYQINDKPAASGLVPWILTNTASLFGSCTSDIAIEPAWRHAWQAALNSLALDHPNQKAGIDRLRKWESTVWIRDSSYGL